QDGHRILAWFIGVWCAIHGAARVAPDGPARPSMAGGSRRRTADRAVRLMPLALPDQHALAGKIEVDHSQDGHGVVACFAVIGVRWRGAEALGAPASQGMCCCAMLARAAMSLRRALSTAPAWQANVAAATNRAVKRTAC